MDSKTLAAEIAGECRRIGWKVEPGEGGRSKWIWKITAPVGRPVYLHGSPSDTNWSEHVWRKLNALGFADAKAEWQAERDAEKDKKLAHGRESAEAATKRLAAKAAAQSAALTRAAGQYGPPQLADIGWMTTPTEFPETRTVIITPDIAAKLLATCNTHNRKMRPRRVAFLERIMRNGEWAATHQGGAIDSTATIQDGQHRLAAIVEADMAVPMQWSVGMDPKNFRKVDTNLVRTARDAAFVRNEADPSALTSVARMLRYIEMFKSQVHVKASSCPLSIDEIDAYVEDNSEELHAAVEVAKLVKKELRKTNPSALAVSAYLITEVMPEDDPRIEAFFRALATGLGVTSETDPLYLLRRLLQNQPRGRGQYTNWETAALIIKTWNCHLDGRPRLLLAWRPAKEPFPHVMNPSMTTALEAA